MIRESSFFHIDAPKVRRGGSGQSPISNGTASQLPPAVFLLTELWDLSKSSCADGKKA